MLDQAKEYFRFQSVCYGMVRFATSGCVWFSLIKPLTDGGSGVDAPSGGSIGYQHFSQEVKITFNMFLSENRAFHIPPMNKL